MQIMTLNSLPELLLSVRSIFEMAIALEDMAQDEVFPEKVNFLLLRAAYRYQKAS